MNAEPIVRHEASLTINQIRQRLHQIAREVGGQEVELEQPRPDSLWAARVMFDFDRAPLTGRGRTPADALACLLGRKEQFEHGLDGNRLDLISFSIADRGLRRAIEIKAFDEPSSHGWQWFELVWPHEDDSLIRLAYQEALGKPLREDDVAQDAYGQPWSFIDERQRPAALAAFVNRLRLMGYAVTTKRIEPPIY